jgi:signal transduction histidine kinase
LRGLLRECADQLVHLGADLGDDASEDDVVAYDVDVRWEVPTEEMLVEIDRQMLRRVLVNLVRNAVEAIRGTRGARGDGSARGRVIVHAERRSDGFAILVEDDGPGVPEAVRDRVFDPYFTTKADGTGLGLAIVKKIVVEHNGAIYAARSERLGGAQFVLTLPPANSLAISAARDSAREPGGVRGATRRAAG